MPDASAARTHRLRAICSLEASAVCRADISARVPYSPREAAGGVAAPQPGGAAGGGGVVAPQPDVAAGVVAVAVPQPDVVAVVVVVVVEAVPQPDVAAVEAAAA